jgi:hypothetical protein
LAASALPLCFCPAFGFSKKLTVLPIQAVATAAMPPAEAM